MSKGDAEHVAQHQHGVQHKAEPPAPQTVEQRLATVEQQVATLEGQMAELLKAISEGRL